MKNKLKNVYKYFLNNKFFCLLILVLLVFFIYLCFNTFIINDDLPYSFFHRTTIRITNIKQVILNQYKDYFNINSRVFVHFVVQCLLIYGKNLWGILNSLIIVSSFITMYKIISIYVNKNNKVLTLLTISSLFLTLISYKRIIFWVAGSVNYVWIGLYLLILIYFYLKHGYSKHTFLNIILILSVSILHETLLVFSIVFVLINYIKNIYLNKKIVNKELLYFIPLIISYIFLMKSPAVIARLSGNIEWNNLSIFEKLVKSFPVISKNFLNITNVLNIIPIILIIVLLICLYKQINRISTILIMSIVFNVLLVLIFKNNWLYLLLSIILFISIIYYNHKKNRDDLSLIFISTYAITYSMGITSEYTTNRSSYIVYLFVIILVILMLYDILYKKNEMLYIKGLFIILLIMLSFDIYNYTIIGNISKERIKSIKKCSENNCKTLYLKRIPLKYEYYHMDINSPSDNDYFAFESFINYYKLPKDITISFYD